MYATQNDMPRGAIGRYGSHAMRLSRVPEQIVAHRETGQVAAVAGGVATVVEPEEREGVVRRWELRSQRGGLSWAAFTASGDHVVVGSGRGREIEVWSARDRERTETIRTRAARQLVAAASPTEDVIAYQGRRELVIYDVPTRKELHKVRLQNLYGTAMAFSGDGKVLVLTHKKGYVAWEMTPTGPSLLTSHTRNYVGWSTALAVSPDGSEFAVANTTGRVELWTTATQKRRGYFSPADEEGTSAIGQLEWRGGDVWAVREDKWSRRVERWDAATPGERPEAWAPGARVAWSGPGEVMIARGTTLVPVRAEELGSGGGPPGHASAVRRLALGPDGALWSAEDDGQVIRWSMEARSGARVELGESKVAPVFAWDGDAMAVWRGSDDREGQLEVWEGGARVASMEVAEQLDALALDAESMTVRAADEYGAVYWYDVKRGVRTRRAPLGQRRRSRLLAASPGLEYVVVDDVSSSRRDASTSLRSWDTERGVLAGKRERPRGAILRCDVNTQGKTACVTSAKTVEVYDEQTSYGEVAHALQRLTGLALIEGGERVVLVGRPLRAIASERDTLRVAEVATGETTHKLDALPGRVTATLMHPDGRRMFLGFSNGLIYEWDLEAFKLDREVAPAR
jgi:WD40 repeat protein